MTLLFGFFGGYRWFVPKNHDICGPEHPGSADESGSELFDDGLVFFGILGRIDPDGSLEAFVEFVGIDIDAFDLISAEHLQDFGTEILQVGG